MGHFLTYSDGPKSPYPPTVFEKNGLIIYVYHRKVAVRAWRPAGPRVPEPSLTDHFQDLAPSLTGHLQDLAPRQATDCQDPAQLHLTAPLLGAAR